MVWYNQCMKPPKKQRTIHDFLWSSTSSTILMTKVTQMNTLILWILPSMHSSMPSSIIFLHLHTTLKVFLFYLLKTFFLFLQLSLSPNLYGGCATALKEREILATNSVPSCTFCSRFTLLEPSQPLKTSFCHLHANLSYPPPRYRNSPGLMKEYICSHYG